MITCGLLLLFFNNTEAQITFEKTFGTTGDNFANDIQLTSDGGYIIVGTAYFTNSGGDIFLIRTNAGGDTLWTRIIGGTGIENGNSVQQTADNGFIIAGSSTNGAGGTDAYLVKTDANGNASWSKTYGTSSNDAAYGVVQTADGGFVFSGTELQQGLNGKAHLVKVDANGNVLWSKTFGNSTRKNFAYTLLQTPDRGFIIGGWENLNLGINDDFCLIKTDSNGAKQWYKSYGDVGHDQNYSVHLTSDGGYIMAGVTFSSSVIDANVVKTDASGNLVWTKNIGGTGAENAYAVTSTSDGGFVFCGSTSSFGATTQGYVVKLDGSGNLLWSKMMSGTGWNGFFAIREASDGGFILAGVKDETYGVSGSLYLVKTDANGNSGCNTSVTSSVATPSILVGTPVATGTSTQIVSTATATVASGTSITAICASCTPTPWYQDADGDSYGNPSVTQSSCAQPTGYVADNTDCNDANATINPGAADVCNGIDDNCNGVVDENAIASTTIPSGNVTLCSGTLLSITANSGNGISYQWYRSNMAISGATNQIYSTKKAGTYSVHETSTFGCTSNSATIIVTVVMPPSATITPLGNLDICQTGSVDLQANSGVGYLYQWKKGTVLIAGATNQIYTATTKGSYRVIVTNNGCSKTSAAVKVTKSCRAGYLSSESAPETFKCYPNPSTGQFTIDMKFKNASSGLATIEIFNSLNQKVYSGKVQIENGVLQESIDAGTSLEDGVYVLKLTVSSITLSKQLIIQH